MAFIKNSTTFFSFAEYADVQNIDQRVFEANEGLTESIVEDMLVRSSERILTNIRDTDWWRGQYGTTNPPVVDGLLIIGRQNDFTELCVFHTLHQYLLPRVADFSDEENSEVKKIDYYRDRYDELFNEVLMFGDWYDADDSETVEDDEINARVHNNVRVR